MSHSPQNLHHTTWILMDPALLYTYWLWFFYHYRIEMIHLSLKILINDRQLQFTMC